MASNAPNRPRYTVYMPDGPDRLCDSFRMEEAAAAVGDLRNAIRNSPEFEDLHLRKEKFDLYKCGTVPMEPVENCFQRVLAWLVNAPADARMVPGHVLTRYFPTRPTSGEPMIDVIVVTEEILELRDVLTELPDADIFRLNKDRKLRIQTIKGLPSPSEGVKDERGIKNSNDGSRGAHYHRPSGNYGPPTGLFHPALARLKHRLEHLDQLHELEPGENMLMECHLLIRNACAFYANEKDRESKVISQIDKLIGENGKWQDALESKTAKPDAVWGDGDIVRVLLELKNEDGIKGNASLQASIAYGKIVSQDKYESFVRRSNCPVVLIGMMGTRLEISTAVFTDGIYVDKLVSQELYLDAWQSLTISRLGRTFKALSLAAAELRNYYNTFDDNPNPPLTKAHLFPDPLPIDEGINIPRLNYIGKLSHRGQTITMLREKDRLELQEDPERPYALYRAKMIRDEPEGEVDVVVKFTAFYNDRAHRILAENGLAPTLHFFAPLVGGMNMVIMDYIKSPPMFGGKERADYEAIYADVEKAIEILHKEDVVFGDLRAENVMRKPKGGAMLIDFDWAGKHQDTRYPASWNVSRPADGIGRRRVMDKQHDILMLDELNERFKGVKEMKS